MKMNSFYISLSDYASFLQVDVTVPIQVGHQLLCNMQEEMPRQTELVPCKINRNHNEKPYADMIS